MSSLIVHPRRHEQKRTTSDSPLCCLDRRDNYVRNQKMTWPHARNSPTPANRLATLIIELLLPIMLNLCSSIAYIQLDRGTDYDQGRAPVLWGHVLCLQGDAGEAQPALGHRIRTPDRP